MSRYWAVEKREHANDGSLRQSGLDMTGVIEIKRQSVCRFGVGTLGIGRILVSFHCLGTVDVASDMLK